MANFILDGRLDVASALVGTFHGEAGLDQTFILALVPDSLPPKEQRALKERIQRSGTDSFARWNPADDKLSGLFSRLSAPQVTMTIQDSAPAADMIKLALDQNMAKNVIYCTNTEAYLSVCSRFGISRRDLASLAELNDLLPKTVKKFSDQGIVGTAHKLCHLLQTDKVESKLSTGTRYGAAKGALRHAIPDILRSEKFRLGKMADVDVTDEILQDTLKGNRTTYLPADYCLFEYDLAYGGKAFLLAQIAQDQQRLHTGIEFGKEDFLITLFLSTPKNEGFTVPWQPLVQIKNGIVHGVQFLHPPFDNPEILAMVKKDKDDYRHVGDYAVGAALLALATINSPAHKPELIQPPTPLQKKRLERTRRDSSEFPYFNYYVLDIGKTAQRESFANFPSSVQLDSNSSGIRQRFHHRSASLRTITHADASKEIKRYSDYWAGDANLGVVSKARDAAKANNPSPQLPV